ETCCSQRLLLLGTTSSREAPMNAMPGHPVVVTLKRFTPVALLAGESMPMSPIGPKRHGVEVQSRPLLEDYRTCCQLPCGAIAAARSAEEKPRASASVAEPRDPWCYRRIVQMIVRY